MPDRYRKATCTGSLRVKWISKQDLFVVAGIKNIVPFLAVIARSNFYQSYRYEMTVLNVVMTAGSQ